MAKYLFSFVQFLFLSCFLTLKLAYGFDSVSLNGHELLVKGQDNDNDIVKAIFDKNNKVIFSADSNEKYLDFAYIDFEKKFTIDDTDYILIRGNCGGTECQDQVYSFGYFNDENFITTDPFPATKIDNIEEKNNSVIIDYVEGVKFKKVAIFNGKNVKITAAGTIEVTDKDFSELYDFYRESCQIDGQGCEGVDDAPMSYVRPFGYFQQVGFNMENFEKICKHSCKMKNIFTLENFKQYITDKSLSLDQKDIQKIPSNVSFQRNFPEHLKDKILRTQVATTFMGNLYGPIITMDKLTSKLNGKLTWEVNGDLIVLRQQYKDPMTNRLISSAWGFYDLIEKKGYVLLSRVIIDGEEIQERQLVNLLSQFSG